MRYFLCSQLLYYYDRLLRRTLLLHQFYSAFLQHPDEYRESCISIHLLLNPADGFLTILHLLIYSYLIPSGFTIY